MILLACFGPLSLTVPIPSPSQPSPAIIPNITRTLCIVVFSRPPGNCHFSQVYGTLICSNNRLSHLPDLKEIVLSSTAEEPWVVEVPAEVSQVVRMSAMHEESGCLLIFIGGNCL